MNNPKIFKYSLSTQPLHIRVIREIRLLLNRQAIVKPSGTIFEEICQTNNSLTSGFRKLLLLLLIGMEFSKSGKHRTSRRVSGNDAYLSPLLDRDTSFSLF